MRGGKEIPGGFPARSLPRFGLERIRLFNSLFTNMFSKLIVDILDIT